MFFSGKLFFSSKPAFSLWLTFEVTCIECWIFNICGDIGGYVEDTTLRAPQSQPWPTPGTSESMAYVPCEAEN